MSLAVYLVGIAVLIAAAVIVQAWRAVMSARLQHVDPQTRPCTKLPAFVRVVYAPTVQALRESGFAPLYCSVGGRTDARLGDEEWTVTLARADARCYADVATATNPLQMPGPEVTFYSVFSDGTLLMTVNGREHSIAGPVPDTEVVDPCAPDLAGQWQAHQARFAELARTRKPVPVSATVHRTRTRMAMNAYIDKLSREGVLRRSADGALSPSPWSAWRLALRMLRGELRLGRLRRPRNGGAAPVEAEARAYRQLREIERLKPFGWAGKTLLFLVSVAAFSLVFGVALSLQTALILVGVLLLHELGHLAAMAVFRYRDLQILFIPFLGAAALGRGSHARPWQRIVVYLMGPVPGIVLGGYLLSLSASRPEPWLIETAVIMLVLNYLNLLPVMPLDGGHIMRLALFDRFPRGRAVMVGVSAALFLAAAWYLDDPLFWVLGAGLAVLAPNEWRNGRLLARIRDALPASERGGRAGIEAVFRAMRGPDFAKLDFPLRYRVARTAREYFGHTHASVGVAVTALAVYVFALVAPIGMLAAPYLHAVVASDPGESVSAPQDWDASLDAATEPAQRWELARQAGDWYADLGDATRSYRYYGLAIDAAQAIGSADTRLADSHRGAARVSPDPELARDHYRKALAVQEQASGADSPEVAALLEEQAWTYAPDGPEAGRGEALLERALAIREAVPDDLASLSGVLQNIAEFRERRGDREGARAALERALASRDDAGAVSASQTIPLVEHLGTLCAIESRYTCAELQFSRMINAAGDTDSPELFRLSTASRGHTKLGWVMFVRGDVRSAQRHLERALEENTLAFASIADLSADRNPALVPLLLDLAYVHWTQGRTGRAREYLDQADGILRSVAKTGVKQHLRDARVALDGGRLGAEAQWLMRRRGAHDEVVQALAAG